MTHPTALGTSLLLVYSTYFVGVASPGPSNLAIMSIAGTAGRRAALAFAAGVMSASAFWAMLATAGLSAALAACPGFLAAVKLFGGAYLLWLGSKSARAALRSSSATEMAAPALSRTRALYSRGLLLHLTNPKAILVWLSVAALGSSGSNVRAPVVTVVSGCLAIGTCVFVGYAMLFSMAWARRVYRRSQRAMNVCLALAFGGAGIRLLMADL